MTDYYYTRKIDITGDMPCGRPARAPVSRHRDSLDQTHNWKASDRKRTMAGKARGRGYSQVYA